MRLHPIARPRSFFTAAFAAALLLAGREPGHAQSTAVTTLYDFPNANLKNPNGQLVQGRNGNFYGTTYAYPTNGGSSFYALSPAGAVGLRHVFTQAEGGDPSSLIQGSDGNFYGTTFEYGANNRGTVFEVTPAGALTIFHTFTAAEGDQPESVIQATDGNFYVAVTQSGIEGGRIYRLTPTGTLSLVHDFTSAEGQQPFALLQGRDGNFYGLTSYGGTNRGGTVFKLTSAGVLTTLFAFGANVAVGTGPGGLFQASDGDLYGWAGGGSYNGGTIFKLPTTGGTPTVLHSFHGHNTNGDGADPSILIQAADGNFYGANVRSGLDDAYAGTLFVVTSAGEFATFYDFPISEDDCDPVALVQSTVNGNLYGATSFAGGDNSGSLFELAFPTGGVFQFPAATYSARETAASVAVPVARVGDTAGAVTVQYATADGSAQAGVDYVAASGMLTWAAGDSAPKTITVQLRYPGVMYTGDPRTFSLNLSAPTGGAVTGVSATATVNIAGTGNPPVITSALAASADVGTPFSYQITAANSPATYGVSGLPGGLTVNAHTGLISGTPKFLGTFSLTLNADSGGGVGSATLTLTVQAAGSPLISSAPTASAAVGAAFSYQIVSGGNPTAYGAQGLPGGLTVNASTGLISGTPTVDGTYTLTLHAYNTVGTGSATLTLIVQKQGTPLITSASTASGKVGAAFSYQIVAGSNLTSYGVGGLVGGLTVDAKTGLISGTPKLAGVSTLTLYAYNAAGKGSATLTLTIAAQ